MFGLFVFVVVVLWYWQRVINGKHPLLSGATSGISWKFHNFLVFPEIVYNKGDS